MTAEEILKKSKEKYIILGKIGCTKCKLVEKLLKENNEDYEYFNIDNENLIEFFEKNKLNKNGRIMLPLTIYKETIYKGYGEVKKIMR